MLSNRIQTKKIFLKSISTAEQYEKLTLYVFVLTVKYAKGV